MLPGAVGLMNAPRWTKQSYIHKRKNPVNSFAIAYDEFLNGATLQQLEDAVEAERFHLDRYIFNSTDLFHGIAFRFLNRDSPGRRFGSWYIRGFSWEDAGRIKLGDVLAASSAFPGGFEPISFPDDFLHNGRELRKKIYDRNSKKDGIGEIALMDGGITDNQGISSLLTGDGSNCDLFFIGDVTSQYIKNPFTFSRSNRFTNILSFGLSFAALVFMLAVTFLCNQLDWSVMYQIALTLTTIVLVLQVLLFIGALKAKRQIGLRPLLRFEPRLVGHYLLDRALAP